MLAISLFDNVNGHARMRVIVYRSVNDIVILCDALCVKSVDTGREESRTQSGDMEYLLSLKPLST